MPAGRPPRWEDLDRIGWLAAWVRSARRGGTRGHACRRSHTYIGTRPRAYICAAGGISLLLGSSTTGGNCMLCSWAQENHRNTWSSERKGDFRHRHGQTGHLDEDSPTSGSSRGEGTRNAPRGPAEGTPLPSPGRRDPPGTCVGRCHGTPRGPHGVTPPPRRAPPPPSVCCAARPGRRLDCCSPRAVGRGWVQADERKRRRRRRGVQNTRTEPIRIAIAGAPGGGNSRLMGQG